MKPHIHPGIAVLLITLFAVCTTVLAGEAGPARSVTPVTSTWSIEPDSTARRGIRPGLAIRLRFVETENITGLGAPQFPTGMDAIRMRARLWADAWFTPNLKGHVGFNHERIDFYHCETCKDKGREIVIENLYVEAFDIAGAPLGLRLGRQNLLYGDGLVICDGTPLDGSRTLYVNAALLTFSIPQWAVDVFAAANPNKDDLLPNINDESLALIETDECLMGIYAKTMPYRSQSRAFTLEPYFIIKRERTENWQDRISTIGGRLEVPAEHFRFRGEAAYQTGHKHHNYLLGWEAKNVSAFGGTAYLDVMLERFWGLKMVAGYVYLAGDNPKTLGKFEGWNPVLGRWPQWSDLYIYTLIPETGIAYWQNIKFPLLQAVMEPYKGLVFDAKVLYMYANQPYSGPWPSSTANPESKKRGNLYALRVSYKIGSHISGHLLYEHFTPGGYYNWLWREELHVSGEPQAADYLRFEVNFTL